jgi:putative oxidoreductase
MTIEERPTGSAVRSGRAAGVIAWVLQVLLALAIAPAGLLKLAGESSMVEMFDDIGLGQWLRLLIGVLEVAGAVALMVPRLRALAALCLLLLLIGATVVNLAVLGTSPLTPIIFGAMALGIVLLRRRELAVLLVSLRLR